MGVITIARQYGAGGAAVGRKVADKLGWNLLDVAIIDQVASRLQLPEPEVEATEERPDSFLDQLLLALGSSSFEFGAAGELPAWTPPFALPGLDTRKAVVAMSQQVIREAARGDAVIIGRGGAYILRDDPSALHVFLRAPEDFRAGVVTSRLGVGEAEARKQIKQTDANRAAQVKQLYGHDWAHPSHYDLVIDTSRLGFDGAADTIVAALRGRVTSA